MATAGEISLIIRMRDETSKIMAEVQKHLQAIQPTAEAAAKAGAGLGEHLRQVAKAGEAVKPTEAHVRSIAPAAEAATKSAGGLLDTLGKIGLAGIGFSAVVGAGKSVLGALAGPIAAASDLNETLSKSQAVFGDSSAAVEKFASTAAQSLGQSRQQALEAAATFGNLFTSLGLSRPAAAGLSTDVVKLASDLASFNNISPTEALEKLRSGLVGESEPLRSLGVNLTEAGVAAEAMRLGLAKSKDDISESAKVQARYSLIMAQSKNAVGDFAKTSTGMANAQRIISASFKDIQTQIGGRLLPVVAPLISAFATALPGALNALTPALDLVGSLVGKLPGLFDQIKGPLGIARDAFLTFRGALSGDWAGHASDQINPIVQTIGKIGLVARDLASVFSGGLEVENFVGNLKDLFGIDLGPFVGVIQSAIPVVQEFVSGVIANITQMVGFVKQGLSGDVLGAVQGFIGLWVNGRVQLVETILGWAQALIGWIAPLVPGLLAQLGDFLKSMLTWLGGVAVQVVEQLAPVVAAFLDWVGPMIPPFLVELGKFGASMFDWLLNTALPAIMAKLAQWGAALIAWIAPRIGPMLLEIGKLLLALGDWFATSAKPLVEQKMYELGQAILAWIEKDVLPYIGAELDKFDAFLRGWLGDRVEDFKKAAAGVGAAIVQGIASGMNSLGAWLKGKLNDFLSLLPAWAKQMLGIASPSKVFAVIGGNIVQGLAAGIADQGATAQKALTEVLDGLQGMPLPDLSLLPEIDTTDIAKRIQDALGGVTGPTGAIGPVLDLSSILNGGTLDALEPAATAAADIVDQMHALGVVDLPAVGDMLRPISDSLVQQVQDVADQVAAVNDAQAAYSGVTVILAEYEQRLKRILALAQDTASALRGVKRASDAANSAGAGGDTGGSTSLSVSPLSLAQAGSGRTTSASVVINNTIDARGMSAGQLTQAAGADLATLTRRRLISGAL